MKSVKLASLLVAAAVIVAVPALSHQARAGDAEATTAAPAAAADQAATTGTVSTAAPADAAPSAEAAKPEAPAEPSTPPAAANAEPPAAAPAAADAAPAVTPAPAAADAAPATTSAITADAKPDPDAAIAAQLHDLANGKFDTINPQQRATVDAFYSGRNYAPLWLTDGKPNVRAEAAIAYLGHVDADGLNPADYPVPDFAGVTDPSALAQAEIRLSASVIAYAHHASIGRVHWSRVSGDISYDQKAPDPADVLGAMVAATDVEQALDAYEPHAPAYLALKAKLAEIRGGSDNSNKVVIADGQAPKLGAKDDRVAALRDRLGLSGDGAVYDKPLADAVKAFQDQHGLKPTGTLTSATIEALNGHGAGRSSDRTADIIIANMERWRWAPHDLGSTYVIVNLPDFMLRVIRDGKLDWTTKIVDGKPSTPTPIMSAEMKTITINPTWNVPPSIVNNEYLPLLRQDSTILQRMGLNVSYNPDGSIHVSQPPGPNNALGQIRFNFPNKFLVYQHDSNQKYLFATVMRDQSHGCMRVEDPAKYAEVLLAITRPGEGYTAERVKRMFGVSENEIKFNTPMPVHLTYQTAFVDDQGKLQLRDDIYGRDRDLLAILKNDQLRKVADTAVERRENTVRREVLAMPDNAFGRGVFGQNFFARMFTNPFANQFAPQPAPRSRTQRRAEAR